jgi:hypothetical protein
MSHYAVVCLYRTGSESNECDIIGVKHTYEEAKKLFDEELPGIISDAEEWDMEFDEEEISENYFEAYGDEWHPSYYMKLYIQEVG